MGVYKRNPRHYNKSLSRVNMCFIDCEQLSNMDDLWVFAYGSLLWKTGFDYDEERTGYIEGYSRRFWQGNVTHRGKRNAPGRVATLIEDDLGLVYGKAFRVVGADKVSSALDHLGARECRLGGYNCLRVPFICTIQGDCNQSSDSTGSKQNQRKATRTAEVITTIAFIASNNNPWYLGDSPMEKIVEQVVTACGHAGHNVEYVTRLADYTRRYMPEVEDPHLFTLDELIRKHLVQRGICLHCFISDVHNNNNSFCFQNSNNSKTSDDHNSNAMNGVQSVLKAVTPKCHINRMSLHNKACHFCCSDCHYEQLVLRDYHQKITVASV